MITKESKNKLIKICKVLFSNYKSVKVNRKKDRVTLYKCKIPVIRIFCKKTRIGVTDLVEHKIPKQLSDFMYGNLNFINFIYEQLVRCNITGKNKLDYILGEITKVKCSNIHRQLNISKVPEKPLEILSDEELVLNDMVEYYSDPDNMGAEVTKQTIRERYRIELSNTTIFYILLILITALSILI